MKVQETYREPLEIYGEGESAEFTISKNDEAHVLEILRDKLYSDKVSAVLREYGTNALDANPPGRRIKVQLPSMTEPYLLIRDFGAGLSQADVSTIYTQYGRSTKRDSNTAIGQLGLGCKSGFAYTSQFNVTSWHNGQKTIYNAFIDESNKGRMSVFWREPCGDETGVEIKIPVRTQDISEFKTKALKVYAYFEPRPEINLNIPPMEYVMSENWWRIRKPDGPYSRIEPVAVMGSIAYPLQANLITDLKPELVQLLSLPIEIRFGIGELSISANRESLEYTPHTIENIKKRLAVAHKAITDKISETYLGCKSIYEARRLYAKNQVDLDKMRGDAQTTFRNLTSSLSTFNGQTLSKLSNSLVAGGLAFRTTGRSSITSDLVVWSKKEATLHFLENTIVVINDVKSAQLQRLLALTKTLGAANTTTASGYYYIVVDDVNEGDIETFIIRNNIKGVPVIRLSTVPFDRAKNPDLVLSDIRRKKTANKIFALDIDSRTGASSDNWQIQETEDDSEEEVKTQQVYMDIYRFEPAGCKTDLHEYKEILRLLKEQNLYDPKTIPIIGLKMVKELPAPHPDHWIHIDKWLEEVATKVIDQKDLELMGYQKLYRNICDSPFRFGAAFAQAVFNEKDKLPVELVTYVEYSEKFFQSTRASFSLLKRKLSNYVTAPDIENLNEKLYSNILRNYPLLAYCLYSNTQLQGTTLKEFLSAIHLTPSVKTTQSKIEEK